MNRIAAASICLCVAIGCGGDGGTPASPPPAPTPATPPPPTPPPAPEPPEAPRGLRVSATGANFIEWSWNPVLEVSGYQVQYSANEAFTEQDEVIHRTASETSYRREGLAARATAYLRVRSSTGMGEELIHGAWSTHVTGMTTFPPSTIVNPEPPTFPLEVALPDGECAFTVDDDGQPRMNRRLTIRTDRHAGLFVGVLPPGSECCAEQLVRLYPGQDNRPFEDEIPYIHAPGGVVFQSFSGETRVGKVFYFIFDYTDESFFRAGGRISGLICEPFYCHVTAESGYGAGSADPLLTEVQRLCSD